MLRRAAAVEGARPSESLALQGPASRAFAPALAGSLSARQVREAARGPGAEPMAVRRPAEPYPAS